MKAIETHYLGATNHRGGRIVASDRDGNRFVMSSNETNYSGEDLHRVAAERLRDKLGGTDTMICGATKRGYVFVFLPDGVRVS